MFGTNELQKKRALFSRTVEGFKVTLTKSDETRHISYAVYIFHECVSIYNAENILLILHKWIRECAHKFAAWDKTKYSLTFVTGCFFQSRTLLSFMQRVHFWWHCWKNS